MSSSHHELYTNPRAASTPKLFSTKVANASAIAKRRSRNPAVVTEKRKLKKFFIRINFRVL
jgi:hypothetical protein